jgi:hypothetical protein
LGKMLVAEDQFEYKASYQDRSDHPLLANMQVKDQEFINSSKTFQSDFPLFYQLSFRSIIKLLLRNIPVIYM